MMKVVCHTNGFSLIETLVAVSILSLVMAGFGVGAVSTIDTNYQNSSLVAATTLAQDKLEELTALDDLPVMPITETHLTAAGEAGGIFDRIVTATPDYAGTADLTLLTATISWGDPSPRTFTLSTVRME